MCAFDIQRHIFNPISFGQTRPVSTNVLIVQDTDVTITGVYVNSTHGSSSQEASYCKMQYRVQSSVTEERLVMPSSASTTAAAAIAAPNAAATDNQTTTVNSGSVPPKSYTPLSALSCMLPPGSADSASMGMWKKFEKITIQYLYVYVHIYVHVCVCVHVSVGAHRVRILPIPITTGDRSPLEHHSIKPDADATTEHAAHRIRTSTHMCV